MLLHHQGWPNLCLLEPKGSARLPLNPDAKGASRERQRVQRRGIGVEEIGIYHGRGFLVPSREQEEDWDGLPGLLGLRKIKRKVGKRENYWKIWGDELEARVGPSPHACIGFSGCQTKRRGGSCLLAVNVSEEDE